MKTFLFLSLSTLFSLNVMASPVCDLPYDLAEEEGVVEISTTVITKAAGLSKLQKNQIIATAKRYTGKNRVTITAAINDLMENSEGGDLYYKVFKFKNVRYTMVEYYPGGNPYGVVFKGLEAVAHRTDGDLNCTDL